jgi:hypothetical protein
MKGTSCLRPPWALKLNKTGSPGRTDYKQLANPADLIVQMRSSTAARQPGFTTNRTG